MGTRYHGWQRQAQAPTVQATLEYALSQVANEQVVLFGSGRTDKGVHALGQVAHFDSSASRTTRQWLLGANRFLTPDIAIQAIREVPERFDARQSAVTRTYCYHLYQGSIHHPLMAPVSWLIQQPLQLSAMEKAAGTWIGEHDFSCFRAAGCQSHSPFRKLISIEFAQRPSQIVVTVTANAFLYHMVRNMVGTLVDIGLARQPISHASALLASKCRGKAGVTAPANGLFLQAIQYPSIFQLEDFLPADPWIFTI